METTFKERCKKHTTEIDAANKIIGNLESTHQQVRQAQHSIIIASACLAELSWLENEFKTQNRAQSNK